MTPRRESAVLGVTFLAVLVVLGWFSWRTGELSENYLVGVVLTMALYGIFALGLSLEIGFTGLPNFGHVAFMAVGAYTSVVISTRWRAPMEGALVGWSVGGAFATILLAAFAGVIAYLPLVLLARKVPRLGARSRLLIAAVPAGLVAVFVAFSMFPLSEHGASNATVMLGVLLGMVLAAALSVLLGLAGLRLREDYLAIVTLGAAQIVYLFTLNEEWLTGGSQGVLGFPRPVSDWARETVWWNDLADRFEMLPVQLAHMVVAVLALLFAYLLLETLARSPWGRVLRAIREDEEVAAALGKNVLLYKLESLMIGSALAAVAGIIFAWNLASVLPEHFLSVATFFTLAILVLGGIGNHRGALLGSVILWGLFEFARNLSNLPFFRARDISFAGPPEQIFVGLILILVVLFRPQGAIGNKEEMSYGK